MNRFKTLLLAGLLGISASAQPEPTKTEKATKPETTDHSEPDTVNQTGPYPRGVFSSPLGRKAPKPGDDEGFGFGPVLGVPSAFDGIGRQEVVLPGSRIVNERGLTGPTLHYGYYATPRQRFLLSLTGGGTLGGADLDYSFIPEGFDGYFSLYFNHTRSLNSAYRNGHVDLGKSTDNTQPWLFRTSAGVGYTTDPSQEFSFSGGLVYQRVSLHSGAFGGLTRPFDPNGNPLMVSNTSTDHLLLLRAGGLYTDVDNLQYPNSGHKLRFQADQAIPIGTTSAAFTRLNLNYTRFQPLHLWGDDPQTLIFNVQVGSAIGQLPQYESYNLGGIYSVRGYQLGELGGGRSYLQSSLEFRAPLGSLSLFGSEVPFKFATFVDYGTALGTASQVYGQPGVVREKPDSGVGYGLGVQAETGIGLVRVEAAFAPQGHNLVYFSLGDRY